MIQMPDVSGSWVVLEGIQIQVSVPFNTLVSVSKLLMTCISSHLESNVGSVILSG